MIGGFFILLIVLAVLAILGGGLYALTMWLRRQQLHPEGDKVEGPSEKDERTPTREPRPEHVRVDTEQRERFIGTR